MERVVEANNNATVVQIQALYNSSSGQEKPISLRTTRRTLKRLGYSHRPQRLDSTLVLAGLDAVAVYTSCEEQLETSTDPVCSVENDPA
ncbi:hypothetical protein PFLUV_G00153750 [Perca fluviatilis]|uniref:Transposase Tc1-like domain-containing protein n=1 Tax=Perca fluviatilis TaxID=8168 RepID=A0A6A5EKD5_PERFL|nr:hypothetical protein PFLUV_G00153750 [Perca fluviatilis]